MGISMELIDELRKRTNCSYQEAKELLEKHNGDLVEAIVEFEKRHGFQAKQTTTEEKKQSLGKKIKDLIQKGFDTKFVIEKEESTVLNIPVNIVILLVLITMPVFWLYIIGLIVLYAMGYKIRLRKDAGQDIDVNKIMDGLGSKVKNATDKMHEKPAAQSQNNKQATPSEVKSEEKKDGYNEITIE